MRRILSLSAVLFLAAVAGCGRSPSETVKQFGTALKAGDFDKMKSLMSKDTVVKAGPMLDAAKKATPEEKKQFQAAFANFGEIEVKSENVTGDTATVTSVASKSDGTKMPETKIYLVKEDGEWKLDGTHGK